MDTYLRQANDKHSKKIKLYNSYSDTKGKGGKMKKLLISIYILMISLSLMAQTYSIEKSSINCSGDRSTSATYILIDATGQSITGKSISSTYIETAGILHMNLSTILGIEENQLVDIINLPVVFSLSGNYPHPCNDMTTIKFAVPGESHINISIYDISGRQVVNLVNETMKPGYYEFDTRVRDYSSGIYFLRMSADNFTSTKKLIVTR